MSQLTIRPFERTDEDYQTVISIWNAVWPEDKADVDHYKYRDETRNPKYYWQRLVVENNGRMVAYGIYCETWWSPRPGKFYFNAAVHPNFQRQGIGTFFYDHVINILQQQPEFVALTADTRESKPESIQFLTKRGFEQVMRYPISHLHVPDFDPQPFEKAIQRVAASDIEIKSAAELMENDPDWLKKVWQLEIAVEEDVPSPEPTKIQPFEEFVKILDNPNFFPEAFLLAKENGRFVSTSTLWKSKANPDKLFTGLTGTLRSHRRRGLATALKVKNIELAQSLGIDIIETDNEENNPMYQINMQLGYKPQPAYLDFHKKIPDES
ncbi:MAG: GNAT family N-acetyltransferase [Chloroflexi bacterium]|nr:MAG: GNAT family N-acetyltransferase [Chloroflexota bacterium]